MGNFDFGDVAISETPGPLTWGVGDHVMRNFDFEDVAPNDKHGQYWGTVTSGGYNYVRHLRSRFYISGCDYPQVSRPGVSEIMTSSKSFYLL